MVDTESLASDATAVNVSDRPIEVAQQEEFRRLGTTVYADYAGAGLYSERQLADVFQVAISHATETTWNTGCSNIESFECSWLKLQRQADQIPSHSRNSTCPDCLLLRFPTLVVVNGSTTSHFRIQISGYCRTYLQA